MIPKSRPVRSRALRESARGQPCRLRIPNVCNHDPATSVLAHPPVGNGGMATKGSDDDGAIACSDCHDALDQRRPEGVSRQEILDCWIRGAQETRAYWRELGLLSVKGDR